MPIPLAMESDGTFCWPAYMAQRMADQIHSDVSNMISTSRLTRRKTSSTNSACISRCVTPSSSSSSSSSQGDYSSNSSNTCSINNNNNMNNNGSNAYFTTSADAGDEGNNGSIALLNSHTDLLKTGILLGKGAFSEVHQVRLRSDSSNKCYAMKHLKFKLMSHFDNFRLAAAELAVEAHLLASFDHPNIIKIRGWAANGVASYNQGRHDSFFLLLDCLDETLDYRIEQWQHQAAVRLVQKRQRLQQQQQRYHDQHHQPCSSNGIMSDILCRLGLYTHNTHNVNRFVHNHHHQHDQLSTTVALTAVALEHQRMEIEDQLYNAKLYLQKLQICAEIASALTYLHERGVIFRDLKPNNIGFLNGRVQLFDFGLSRELPGLDVDLLQPFEMSGKVGTLRYMAVEVACHQPYNVSADVYSWAMVSYEVLSLQKPFANWTREMHASLVCGRAMRPEMSCDIAHNMQALLHAAWSQRAHERPSMINILHQVGMLIEEQVQHAQQLLLHLASTAATASTTNNTTDDTSSCMSNNSSNNVKVELPHNFNLNKLPQRSTSDGLTNTTVSILSNESLAADYSYSYNF